jgi:hypothetical protein
MSIRSRSRFPWLSAVTAFDLLVVLVLALAAFVAWTGGVRYRIGSLRISVTDPFRTLAWAVGLGAIRWAIWRRTPGLFRLRILRSRERADADRAAFTALARSYTGAAPYVAGVVMLSLVPLWPHLTDVRAAPDPGDPFFSAWRVAWVAHQLVTAPTRLFDANIFYPTPLTLTFSDSVLLPAFAGAPLIWLGIDPIVVANLLFLAAFPLAGVAFFFAAARLTGDLKASFIAGLLGSLYPFRFEHYSHLELQYFLWVPLALVAALALLAEPRIWRGAVLGLLIAAQWFSSMYFGIMLVTYLVPFTLVVALGWRVRPNRRLAESAAAVVVVLAVTLPWLAAPYVRSQSSRGERNLEAVQFYSAAPSDFFEAHPRSAMYGRLLKRNPQPERQLFSGVTPIAFSLLALPPPLPVPVAAIWIAGGFAADWTMGANGVTYEQLYRWVGPYRSMRVPARFTVFVGSSLILLSAYGLRRLFAFGRSRRMEHALFMVCAAATLADMWPRLALRQYWTSRPPIYDAVSPDMVLAEFPMGGDAEFAYEYFSTAHWARLVNGYSGFTPQSFLDLQRAMQEVPIDDALSLVRRRGATHVTVNCALYQVRSRCARLLTALDGTDQVRLVTTGTWEGAQVRLYEFLPLRAGVSDADPQPPTSVSSGSD